jgi:hypothetical protein|nr:MAG TPA: Putative methionine and alanine importer, small subunit [Caudoviricetes sp.]
MGSFINGLAKGFIRSAVNQVGRDAGRVVSNNIYGDAHSIPHRNVSAGGAGRVSSVGKIEDEGIQPIVPSVCVAWIWGFVGFLFSIIGGVILLIVGYRKLKRKYTAYGWQYESRAVYVADGRYKRGERYDGHQLSRSRVEIEADEYIIARNEKIAKIYLYFGFAAVLGYILVMLVMPNVPN